jgi:hypothetical protein
MVASTLAAQSRATVNFDLVILSSSKPVFDAHLRTRLICLTSRRHPFAADKRRVAKVTMLKRFLGGIRNFYSHRRQNEALAPATDV